MMNDKIKNMNDMTKDEIYNAIRIIAEKTGIVIVDAVKINDTVNTCAIFISCDNDENYNMFGSLIKGYLYGLSDIDGNEYNNNDIENEYVCPSVLIYDYDDVKFRNRGLRNIKRSESGQIYWMKGGIL